MIINQVFLVSYGMQSYLNNDDFVEGGDPNKTLEDIFVHTAIGGRGETVSQFHSQFICRYQS